MKNNQLKNIAVTLLGSLWVQKISNTLYSVNKFSTSYKRIIFYISLLSSLSHRFPVCSLTFLWKLCSILPPSIWHHIFPCFQGLHVLIWCWNPTWFSQDKIRFKDLFHANVVCCIVIASKNDFWFCRLNVKREHYFFWVLLYSILLIKFYLVLCSPYCSS